MSDFLLKLFLSFLVGGLYTGFTIWLAENHGSKLGGLATGLPSRTVLTLVFISWTQGTAAALTAVPIMPIALSINALYIVAFIKWYRFGTYQAFTYAMILWFVCTLPLVFLGFNSLIISLLLSAPTLAMGIFLLKQYPHRKLAVAEKVKNQFWRRVFIAGLLVALSVLAGKLVGPIWGGLIASFPVAYTSSLFMIARNYGIEFTSAVARTMPFGTIGNVIFTAGFYIFTPLTGAVLSAAVAYICAIVFAFFCYKFILAERAPELAESAVERLTE